MTQRKPNLNKIVAQIETLTTTMRALIQILENRGFIQQVTASGMMDSLDAAKKQKEKVDE